MRHLERLAQRQISLTETARLTIPTGLNAPFFGGTAAISNDGTIAIVGAPDSVLGGSYGLGAAYIYVEPPTGWSTTSNYSSLIAAQNGFGFGYSVAMSGTTIVSGSLFQSVNSQQTGAAFVFGDSGHMLSNSEMSMQRSKP
jgi:hypothetical protein